MLQAALTLWKEDLYNTNLQDPAFNTGLTGKRFLKHLLLEPKGMTGPRSSGNLGVGRAFPPSSGGFAHAQYFKFKQMFKYLPFDIHVANYVG